MPETMRTRTARLLRKAAQALSPVGIWANSTSSLGWTTVLETTTGSWQQDVPVNLTSVTANWAVWSCASLISGDIAKMPACLQKYNEAQEIWEEGDDWALLRRPNRYQTWIEFSQSWDYSQLFWGNTYVLKERDRKGEIVALYVLDPCRVTPLVAEDGSIYYELAMDNLAHLQDGRVIVPASEIIHDRYKTPWHPLIGVSPLYACGAAASQGIAIQGNSTAFFQNLSRPGGFLTVPGSISLEKATELKANWQSGFTGDNAGKVALLSDGLTYQQNNIISASDSQLLEQLKFTGEMVCACFHVPPYKLGLGVMPTVANTGILNQEYFEQALQYLVTKKEARLTEGLELRQPNFRVSLDESALLRMDPAARMESYKTQISSGMLAPNEARRDENRPPLTGGDVAYLQVQNYSLEALNKRDSQPDPFAPAKPAAPALPAPAPADQPVDETMLFIAEIQKTFRAAA